MTTMCSAFRQELEIPLSLSPDWQVALFSMYYTHSFGNAVLKSPTGAHCEMGYVCNLRATLACTPCNCLATNDTLTPVKCCKSCVIDWVCMSCLL